jgi:S1-C subfamily serine protease
LQLKFDLDKQEGAMLRTLIGLFCLCLSIPAQAKLGETVPQLISRFGKNYTIESDAIGKTYRFRSEKVSVDALVANGLSVAETYFSDHPLTPSGEPPNDIVRAVLKTNAPQTRWVEIDAAPFRADYALRSSDHEYIAVLRYTGQQPEDTVWTMTVGRPNVVGSLSTVTPSLPSAATTPLVTPVPTPAVSAAPVIIASPKPAPHIDSSPKQFTPLNAATAIVYLYILGAVIVSIWAAQMLEKRLKARLPQTLPYRWGYYCGCMSLACAPFALLFACAAIIFAAYDKAELFGEYLAYAAYSGFQALCGWFIIKRRWWAWVFGTIFSFNIVLWIINGIYGRNRRKELSKAESEISAAPTPLPEPDTASRSLAAPKPDHFFPQKTKTTAALLFSLCGIAFCAVVILLLGPWKDYQNSRKKASTPHPGYLSTDPNAGQALSTPLPRIDFEPEALTPAEIFSRARPSVVLLTMQDARGQPISLGSGFFIDKDVVATNFHVIDGAAAGHAKITGQTAKLNIKGTIAVDALHDLALLQLDASSAVRLPVASKLSVNIGDAVYAIGNPKGLEGTFSEGIVSSVRALGSDRILQITAPISPGSSGGPVLDQSGNVVGVSFATIEKGQNLNFAIPSDYLAALQVAKTELRPFIAIPRAKLRTTLLDRLGNERPLAGVVGESLTYDGVSIQTGEFSLSLHNKLRENVAGVYGIAIFHDVRGQPIDVYPINYRGLIPAGTAKLISGVVDPSVERLNCPDRPFPYLSEPPRPPKGKVEVRILDFTVE